MKTKTKTKTKTKMKTRSIIVFVGALLLLTGCKTKSCRCYLLEKWGNVVVSETYIDPGTDCSELGYSTQNRYDLSYRYCTDFDDPEIDTMEIVRRFWGKTEKRRTENGELRR